ncbi:MAG: stage II sporulation protein M [Methanosarcinaceae archaeon]|nr:stage II sporulation protein M [Methanosarcinaceae archaeon]
MNQNPEDTFRTGWPEFFWSARLFVASGALAFLFSIAVYLIMVIFAEPEPVSEVIAATAVAATAKVEVGARYVSPMCSIFFFNTIAAFTASFGTGVFSYVHTVLGSELELRTKHRRYANISIKFDQAFTVLYKLMRRVAPLCDPRFSRFEKQINPSDTPSSSVWRSCGYTKEDYRMFAYLLPYTVPVLVVNGMLTGILLAFFVFNGALGGYEVLGLKGSVVGVFYTLSYFVVSILPHGIIELPVLFFAAAVGYRFAVVQSDAVLDNLLFEGDDIESVNRDVSRINSIIGKYLRSRFLWTVFAAVVVLLLLAAYIEVHVTPQLVEYVMFGVERLLDGGF